ncbi:LTA synthase family protein [Peloplasma aerotolerans]|uniref:LTA synthase family protein n=1 Tax=Peloplasma aerotolerans TaxID=3044389 RepID=A0AAW6U2U2_9MOLU|nr:LTA synthase family protein [Mariniplasma sp. M4Ah]MDI6452212.1 LTA synthase family protein [Mariniplasma sp. M4Ah]
MKNKNPWHIYFIFIGAFFLLNILNTYMLTVQGLNRYIAPFKHTFLGEINAFFGNFSVLFLMLLLLFIFIKKAKSRMISLIILTLILNLFIFSLGVFNLFFGTAFSLPASTIFNNPADGFAMGTFLQAILELITYYRIIVFLPTIILTILYFMADRVRLKEMQFQVTIKKTVSGLLIVVLFMFSAVTTYYDEFAKTLPLNSAKSTFAIQNLGVYPYYLGEFFGQPLDIDLVRFLELNDEQKLATAYQEYNKNQSSYTNFFDGNTYSNRLHLSQAVDGLYVDPAIANGNNLHGILEGKNLVLIHLESLNSFLLENQYTNERLIFLNRLMSQSFVFNNFYNNVGMGVSSDGELAVLTGLYPMGDRTLYWEFDKIQYVLNTIPKYFNQLDYHTEVIHGDNERFYNRDHVYPELMMFDNFYSLEDYIEDGYIIDEGYVYDTINQKVHHSPWISDYHLAETTNTFGQQLIQQSKPFMLFSITMMPHTPYEFDPNGLRTDIYPQYAETINPITLRYINYVDYVDDIIKRFLLTEFNEDQTLDNSVYVFYSDHGSGLKNGDINVLLDRDISVMETRKILQQVPAFIYVPGDEFIDYGDYQIRKGLLTGEQNLVRSQVDLYRTIIELFNLPVGQDAYYGVHGMSTEPTFALDNRLMDVVLDQYFYSMRNKEKTHPEAAIVSNDVYDYILRFKILSDILISTADMQKQVNQAIVNIYGD